MIKDSVNSSERNVSIKYIELHNFKNIANGRIYFIRNVIGIYGQNGSGKTAVIEALDFFQKLVMGASCWSDLSKYIYYGKCDMFVMFCFNIQDNDSEYEIKYKYGINKKNNYEDVEYEFVEEYSGSDEKSYISYSSWNSQSVLEQLGQTFDLDEEKRINLQIQMGIAKEAERSIVFSRKIIESIYDISAYNTMIKDIILLRSFSISNLFVITSKDIGAINLKLAVPFSFKSHDRKKIIKGTIPISISDIDIISQDQLNVLQSIIDTINIVIPHIIPNVRLYLENYGEANTADGLRGVRVELLSVHNDMKIPIQYESAGIIKIISILSAIIAMYNHRNICVVVDELDSGVFEYLLGDILNVIDKNGKGQLLFTSHNLRILETINKQSVIFTTINPENRYVTVPSEESVPNLRDWYLRKLLLGTGKNKLNEGIDIYDLGMSLVRAGRTEI